MPTNTDVALFQPPMSLIDLLACLLRGKILADFLQQPRLVALKSADVVVAALNNYTYGFFWVLMASKANTTPLRAIILMNSGKAVISLVLLETS